MCRTLTNDLLFVIFSQKITLCIKYKYVKEYSQDFKDVPSSSLTFHKTHEPLTPPNTRKTDYRYRIVLIIFKKSKWTYSGLARILERRGEQSKQTGVFFEKCSFFLIYSRLELYQQSWREVLTSMLSRHPESGRAKTK